MRVKLRNSIEICHAFSIDSCRTEDKKTDGWAWRTRGGSPVMILFLFTTQASQETSAWAFPRKKMKFWFAHDLFLGKWWNIAGKARRSVGGASICAFQSSFMQKNHAAPPCSCRDGCWDKKNPEAPTLNTHCKHSTGKYWETQRSVCRPTGREGSTLRHEHFQGKTNCRTVSFRQHCVFS